MKDLSKRFYFWYSRICDPSLIQYVLKNPIWFEGMPFSWEVAYEIISFKMFSQDSLSVEEIISLSRNRYTLLDSLWPGAFPTEEEVELFYLSSYNVLPWGHGIWIADHNDRQRHAEWVRRIDVLLQLKQLKVDTVLDYGAGGGHTALAAMAAGFKSVGYHEYSIWHPYIRWRLRQSFPTSWQKMHFSAPDGKVFDMAYDAVICSDVPEHVYDPIVLLQNLNSLIRPGGFLVWVSLFGDGIDCHMHPQYKGKEEELLKSFGFAKIAPLAAQYRGYSGVFQYNPSHCRSEKTFQKGMANTRLEGPSHLKISDCEEPLVAEDLKQALFSGNIQVYLASADNMGQTIQNLENLKTNILFNVYKYTSVIGGLSGLNYIAALRPENICFFDINEEAISYAQFIFEMIGICEGPKDFISRIFSRSIDLFELKNGLELDYQSQEKFLAQTIDSALMKETLSMLSADGSGIYKEYILPRLRHEVLPGTFNCRRLLPCWPVNDRVPVGAGEDTGYDKSGKRVPNINTFFYGHGWLGSVDDYKELQNALQQASISFRSFDLLATPCKDWIAVGRSNILHASNINAWLPEKWTVFGEQASANAQKTMTDLTVITSHDGVFYWHKDSHCRACEALLPHVVGSVLEITHKPNWGFHEFSPTTVVVEDYLKEVCSANTIIVHILLGNGISPEVFSAVVEKALCEGEKVLVLEHDRSSSDWCVPLHIPHKSSLVKILHCLAEKYGKRIEVEKSISGVQDDKRNFFVLLQ